MVFRKIPGGGGGATRPGGGGQKGGGGETTGGGGGKPPQKKNPTQEIFEKTPLAQMGGGGPRVSGHFIFFYPRL